jgi:lipopolysaccharide transport system ATP-binding protein
MSDTVIKVENLSKQYRLGTIGTGTLSHDLNRWWARMRGKEDPYLKVTQANIRDRKAEDGKLKAEVGTASTGSPSTSSSHPSSLPSDYVWALRDINFEVKRGEVLGIIGKNGAGKSTLLKILSRITSPTQGHVKINGRIASLLEVGVGFHPELTGRENIFLNGAIMGMSKAETAAKLDEIVDFSGCERYVDTPVKRYSSGMKVRLGFAVAAHLDPEILIVDEVLAVGDAEFQKKCLGKMGEVAEGGRTVLFVSHNMATVEALCPTAILLGEGTITEIGDGNEIIEKYLRKRCGLADGRLLERSDRVGLGTFRFASLSFIQAGIDTKGQVKCGGPLEIVVGYSCKAPFYCSLCTITFYDLRGNRVAALKTVMQEGGVGTLGPRDTICCSIAQLPLLPGEYVLNIAMVGHAGVLDHIDHAARLTVVPSNIYGTGYLPCSQDGFVFIRHTWSRRESADCCWETRDV